MENAEARAAAAEGSVGDFKDKLVRLQADFENFRKRSSTQIEQSGTNDKVGVAEKFIPLIDNFELARQQIKCETEGEEKINSSYQGLYKQMVDIFKALGVEAIPTVGTQFDPNVHEAIMMEPRDDVPDNEIIQEFRKGFTINGVLIRPAMVQVAQNDSAPTPSAATDNSSSSSGGVDGGDGGDSSSDGDTASDSSAEDA